MPTRRDLLVMDIVDRVANKLLQWKKNYTENKRKRKSFQLCLMTRKGAGMSADK